MPSFDKQATLSLQLPNGVRIHAEQAPHLHTASVSVFLRCGSSHEAARDSGIGHVIEHMVFKGAGGRNARSINLDAERLGADVNAHTDKDHTAFHMRGHGQDAPRFVGMLADLVCAPSFPADELEREREVLLHEMTEVEDDPMATAFQTFDRACYGVHAAARPVIGSRRNVERFTRDELAAWVAHHYSGVNTVVTAIGPIDLDAFAKAAERAFSAMPAGTPNLVEPPVWQGGVRSRRHGASSQTHIVLGFPIAGLGVDDDLAELGAVLFGEGMSSPLMAELREKRGLAYYTACGADRFLHGGQFTVELSIAPRALDETLTELRRMLLVQAEKVTPVDLERARRQMAVRLLRGRESATRRLESVALDLLARGALRSHAERLQAVESAPSGRLRSAFAKMLAAPPALAISGSVPRGASLRGRALFGEPLR